MFVLLMNSGMQVTAKGKPTPDYKGSRNGKSVPAGKCAIRYPEKRSNSSEQHA
ncbi:hypothetical protein [Lacisediminimonas sp.]|uniref:hypothetical protein n=1 Tax=Lacisediminimonas sp. TaxID=3060582 RepID=UPI0027200ECE|nr:hypothetical protein [Lacisediminimonas sp.]MDO8301441.1 hypothetical protein [Lacisediminimonas sp.]MDO9216682.1 hypothetical protein [Lacisediminimonas sp.]